MIGIISCSIRCFIVLDSNGTNVRTDQWINGNSRLGNANESL